jgi:protein-tyrosine phosphatase
VSEPSLRALPAVCNEHGIDVISFPIPDRGVPASLREATNLARLLATRIEGGKSVGIHCRARIGRSGMMAACVLSVLGMEPNPALVAISAARGVKVPDTVEQRE